MLADQFYDDFSFLKMVSGYDKPLRNGTPDVFFKRLTYVKTFIKLLSVYANRHRNTVSQKEHDIYIVISRQLNELESVVDNEEEMIPLLRELLCIVNINYINNVAVKAFSKWIETKPGNGVIVKSLLKSLGVAVKETDLLANLLEITINSYFVNMGEYLLVSMWLLNK